MKTGEVFGDLADKRMVAFIPIDAYVERYGWRVSFVVEGEDGHRPTGNWPCDYTKGHQMPWFWNGTYDEVCQLAVEYNARLGFSAKEAEKIVRESIFKAIEDRSIKQRYRSNRSRRAGR